MKLGEAIIRLYCPMSKGVLAVITGDYRGEGVKKADFVIT